MGAYPALLAELRTVMLRELRVAQSSEAGRHDLRVRAEAVRGLTGNYRLDAFATRLQTFDGQPGEMEGIAGLAANKPPRDWVDRDVDHARIDIASLAQEFVRAEAFAHVKGREDGRVRMAIFISDPRRPSPVKPDFDIAVGQHGRVRQWADARQAALERAGAGRDMALAALAELGARLAEPDPEPALPLDMPVEVARRTRASR